MSTMRVFVTRVEVDALDVTPMGRMADYPNHAHDWVAGRVTATGVGPRLEHVEWDVTYQKMPTPGTYVDLEVRTIEYRYEVVQ